MGRQATEMLKGTLEGIVLGILAGIETARVIGLGLEAPTEALPLGPVPLQFLGAGLIALAVAVAVYFGYSIKHSRLERAEQPVPVDTNAG